MIRKDYEKTTTDMNDSCILQIKLNYNLTLIWCIYKSSTKNSKGQANHSCNYSSCSFNSTEAILYGALEIGVVLKRRLTENSIS